MNPIENLLPHRKPFLFVDSIESADQSQIVAWKTFNADEFFFPGHFPGYPVVPGVILVETLAQAGGAGVKQLGLLADTALFFLATVEKAKFRRQVKPGERARLEVTNLKVSARMLCQSGKVYIGGDLAAEAEWMCLVGSAEGR